MRIKAIVVEGQPAEKGQFWTAVLSWKKGEPQVEMVPAKYIGEDLYEVFPKVFDEFGKVNVAAIGAAVIGWAYVVLGQTVRIDWRRGIKETEAANTLAAMLLALGAALHPGRGASALMAFVSLDVISIAVAPSAASNT